MQGTTSSVVRSIVATDALGVVSRLLTVAAVVLIGQGLIASTLRLDGFGLAGSLPSTYYVGLAMLPFALPMFLAPRLGARLATRYWKAAKYGASPRRLR